MSKKKETYKMSRSHLLSYIIPIFSNLDIPKVNEGKVWHHYYGFSNESIPIGSLVCPILVENSRAWYLGWYQGTDDNGNHLIESIETRTICKFTNCGFYYLEPKEFENMPQMKYSDSQFYQDYLIKHKYCEVGNYRYCVGWTVFHDDGSFTVKCRKRFSNTWVERNYKSMRAITKKQIKAHFEDVQKAASEKEEKTDGKHTLIAAID